MFENFKVRCSSVGMIMSESRSNPTLTELQGKRLSELEGKEILTDKQKEELSSLLVKKSNGSKIILSDTCISYLVECYAWHVFKKKPVLKEIDFYATEKGKEMEQDAITLLSRVDKQVYEKNTDRIFNDFLTGEPDICCDRIVDIKAAWDYPGFLKKINTSIDPYHDYQIKGYVSISKLPYGEVAHCLVSSSEKQIFEFLQKKKYQMGIIWDEDPEWLKKAEEIENSMRFDDIPMHQRVYKIKVEPFSPEQEQKLYDRVKVCREWLENFHEKYTMMNKNVPLMLNDAD